MSMALTGFGTAVPEHSLTQSDAVDLHTSFCGIDSDRSRTLRALYRRCGVKRRHSVILDASDGPAADRQRFYPPAYGPDDPGPGTAERMARYEAEAPRLAVSAAGRSLDSGGASANEVTHLVTVSCTGFVSPGVDAALIDQLGLPATVQRTNVGFMGCHGALNGLRVARSYLDADPGAVVLLCAVELCSLHFAYGWDPEMLVANALFADGAAAVLGRAGDGKAEEWRIGGTGASLLPDSKGEMTWRIGDHGFRMTLSARVPELIEAHLGSWMHDWLAAHGLGVADVASWAVHPGGPRILRSVEAALGLERDATRVSREVLSEYGNMSSPTILFILDRMRSAGAELPCVAMAFGPGLVVEAILIV